MAERRCRRLARFVGQVVDEIHPDQRIPLFVASAIILGVALADLAIAFQR